MAPPARRGLSFGASVLVALGLLIGGGFVGVVLSVTIVRRYRDWA